LIGSVLGGPPLVGAYASAFASFAVFAIVSYIMLVFADLAPKSIASQPTHTFFTAEEVG
jgi:CBS domain containing-hemolysin-like protein